MSEKSRTQRAADVLDVHVVDIAAQLEAILRSVREVQRGVLMIRGALPRRKDVEPAVDLQRRFALMLEECAALTDAVNAAATAATSLVAVAGQQGTRVTPDHSAKSSPSKDL